MKNTQKTAFTLIELLVVISIIGLLSSVVLASLNGARSSARDSGRIQAVNQIRTALEQYRLAEGHYPRSPRYVFTGEERPCGYNGAWCDSFGPALEPHISNLPEGTHFDREIMYKNPSQLRDTYGLRAKLENPNDASKNDGGYSEDEYEVGNLPSYCMQKYSGGDRRWYSWDSSNACIGGN